MERLFSDIDDLEQLMPSEHDLEQYASLLLEEQLPSSDDMPAGNVDVMPDSELIVVEDDTDDGTTFLPAPPRNHQSSSMQANGSTEAILIRRDLDQACGAERSRFASGIPSRGGLSTDRGETQTAKNMDPTKEKQLKRKLANRESAQRSRKKKQDFVHVLREEITKLHIEIKRHKEEKEVLMAQVKELRTEFAKVQVKNKELEFKVAELSQIFNRLSAGNMLVRAQAEGNKDKGLQQFNATADQLGSNSKPACGKQSCVESMQKDRLDGFDF